MESITKNRQTVQTLKAIIARAYGDDLVPEGDDFATELGNGWFNVAYAIVLADGRRVVLKIAPPRDVEVMTYERGMMRNELTAIALVREHTAVPVPRIDFADDSCDLVDATWFFTPFVDGDNVGVLAERGELSPEDATSYTEQLGTANRMLNTIVGDRFGPLHGPGFATWREAFLEMLEDVLRDGERAGVDIGWDYADVRAAIAADADALDEVTEPRFVEWDLWAGNVLVRDGWIVSILDHERAFYGDPLIENGFIALDLPIFGDADAFVRGYGRGPLTAGEARRRRLYTLHVVLIMIIEPHYRGHQDTGQYDWGRARMVELKELFERAARAQPGAG